jgi:hypothetical protein
MKKLSIILLGIINISCAFSQNQNIVLVGGRMDPKTGGNELLPKNYKAPTKPGYNSSQPQVVALTSGTYTGKNGAILFQPPATRRKVESITTDANKTPKPAAVTINDNNVGLNNYNNSGSGGLLDNLNNNNINLTPTQPISTPEYAGSLLDPLNPAPAKDLINNYTNTNTNKILVESVDPELIKGNGLHNKINANIKSVNNNTREQSNIPANTYTTIAIAPQSKMPELAPIEGQANQQSSSLKMPALATINGQPAQAAIISTMPELAPIESEVEKKTATSLIPQLAPIEDENKASVQSVQEINSLKVKTSFRGLTMPKGTSMVARSGRSFLFQPAIPFADTTDEIKNNMDELMSGKPSAGGGMGMIALAPIEVAPKETVAVMPAFASIDDKVIVEVPEMPRLAANAPPQVQPAKQLYTSPAPNLRQPIYSQPQTAVPCQHIHAVNCPCCNVGKKVYTTPKKKWTAKKRYYVRPVSKTAITKAYQQQNPNRTGVVERIVYVPMNQRTAQKQVAPAQQNQAPAKQEKVVYRVYTNAYNKQQGVQQSNQLATAAKYYDSRNYAPGLVSGPTSGDYPATSNTSNVDMQYSFYLNKRGKYSVGVYNNACSIILSQDGKIKEYKINADSRIDPKYYKPKLNFFGSPENVAGIPIEYNYNRTVHKIGDVVFDYDFEGFFEKVGSSAVNYNSRSSMAQVDGINVHYDPNNDVVSVDPNNGLIQFNP